MNFTIVFEIPLDALPGSILDISSATPCQFRLVDCTQLTVHDILCIRAYPSLSSVPYSTISYVWRGNPPHPDSNACGTFTVSGAEASDPISIAVLRHACTASLQAGAPNLWLDRLCIIETDADDKAWQISRMHQIYASCVVCLVLPGGIRRLVGLDEETPWIHRAWTLQEAVAPHRVEVLFAWTRGAVTGASGSTEPLWPQAVIPHQSSVADLSSVLTSSMGNAWLVVEGGETERACPRIFGAESSWDQRKVLLGALEESHPDIREQAIWRSTMMRTASRPVDVILSIMGLFGVTLDASAFRSTDQRGAAIALAQAILRKGSRASWLGAVFHLPPDKRLSAFPAFPQPSASGAGRVPVKMEYPGWWLDGVPGGSMDDAGYFTFTSKAAPLVLAGASPSAAPHDGGRVVNARRSGRGATVAAIDGSMWEIQDSRVVGNGGRKHGGAFIVFLGRLEQDFRGARARMLDTLRAILVQAHAPERFHRISYFVLYDKWQPVIDTWEERRFSVGGRPDE